MFNPISRRSFVRGTLAAIPAAMLAGTTWAETAPDFGAADRAIADAVAAGQIPGAVLCAGRKGGHVYLRAYGNRAVEPERMPMTEDTVFDLASLTKPVATATSVMILVERGAIAVTDRVAKYLPVFAQNGKMDVTVEQLLLHRGGVVADNSMTDYENVAPEEAMRRTLASHLRYEPGTKIIYSDVGFITLGELVRVVGGKPVNEFARENVFEPLKMTDTTYLPGDDLKKRCAPTEKRDGEWRLGEVHDPRAYALGKVAGHAGLFGTAGDLSRYCRMLLNGGELDGVRVLKESTVADMTKGRALPDGTGMRGYGLDVDTGFSAPRGERFAKGKSFGHTGFTGTSLWVDPTHDAFVVLLTNAVHPVHKGKPINALRKQVGTAVAEALGVPAPAPEAAPAGAAGQG